MLVLIITYSLFEIIQNLLLIKVSNNKNSQNNADRKKTHDKKFFLYFIEIGYLVWRLLVETGFLVPTWLVVSGLLEQHH